MSSINPRQHYLVCSLNAWDVVRANLPDADGGVVALRPGGESVAVFGLASPGVIEAADSASAGLQYRRVFDRFHLIFDTARARRDVERELFELIAADYENLIEVGRNLSNIANLISFVRSPGGGHDTILDFGCGTGLSACFRAAGIDLVGYDINDTMLETAVSRGIMPIGREHLLGTNAPLFDGMIASYVFDLYVPPADLIIALRRLRVGGRVAANFHQGRGLDEVSETVCRTGSFQPLRIQAQAAGHGAYRGWVRCD